MCYERRYYDSQTAASQAKQQDRKREELVKGLLRDAEKVGEKTNENKIPSKEPAPAK
jgi:hypothetical protein